MRNRLTLVCFLAIATAGISQAVMIDFTSGLDTQIWDDQGGPDQETGTNWIGTWVGGRYYQSMIRFDDMFGDGAGQIPLGSAILSAHLFQSIGYSSEGLERRIYEMTGAWHPGIRWYQLAGGNGLQPGVNMSSVPVAAYDSLAGNQVLDVDVTSSVQMWSNGSANLGWGIWAEQTDGSAFAVTALHSFETSDYDTPFLRVEFEPFSGSENVPEPASIVLLGAGAAALARVRRRKARRRLASR
jgi:hypothetical protein